MSDCVKGLLKIKKRLVPCIVIRIRTFKLLNVVAILSGSISLLKNAPEGDILPLLGSSSAALGPLARLRPSNTTLDGALGR